MTRRYFAWLFVVLCCFLIPVSNGYASEEDFEDTWRRFSNFLECELTRTDSAGYFDGKSFEIKTITLFDARQEGDVFIATGTVRCWVDDAYQTLYAAVGVKKVLGHDKVMYLTVRDSDFSILASELSGFPYKQRCQWIRYRIDIE